MLWVPFLLPKEDARTYLCEVKFMYHDVSKVLSVPGKIPTVYLFAGVHAVPFLELVRFSGYVLSTLLG